ncbi:MAG: class I SAM-dependent DNA methyltransferase, partial [Candidatus Helarchaeota archaeon]
MKVFEGYARFYDTYYKNKDYNAEVDFVLNLAKKNSIFPHTILDVGCGTGGHLIPFVKKGLNVSGFDLSEEMINQAKQKIKKTNIAANVKVDDARTYRDGKKYDLVVSMFAVMGYLISNEDFLAALKTVRIHLNK